MKHLLYLLAPAMLVVGAGPALAQDNVGPPSGAIFSVTGEPITGTFEEFRFSFVASEAITSLTFALRNDPSFVYLDDISFSTGGGANLLVNGGFEDGAAGEQAPPGWTYANIYGADAGGRIVSGYAHSGNQSYGDGAIQAYDAISQDIATTIGTTYDVSFWLAGFGGDVYRPVADNGGTGTGGNGIDVFVYAQAGLPPAPGVPEPAAWAMMIGGFGLTGGALRRRTKVAFA